MKKLIVAILAVLYLGTSSGATLHLHYCMGKLVGMDLWSRSDNTCGKCGMKKSAKAGKDCCKDEHKIIKLEKDHTAAVFLAQMQELSGGALQPVVYSNFAAAQLPALAVSYPVSHAPPRTGSTPLFVRNCVFLI
jgi:hypothetical protein